jgi:hypothetical protein
MKQQLGKIKHKTGLMLVRKPILQAQQERVIREGSTGRVVTILSNALMIPRVWAVAEGGAAVQPKWAPKGVLSLR